MALDIAKIEAEITTIAGKGPDAIAAVSKFITAVKGSPIEAMIEARWPGIATASTEATAVLDFLSKLDAAIVQYLPEIFAILDLFFPKAA